MATERTVLVRVKSNPGDFIRGIKAAQAAVKDFRSEIDTTNDRTAWMAQSLLALGPAIAPLGAAAVPVVAGIATQLTIAGVAAGTAALAFNGVGDALKALNDYQLDPTEAHLKKLNETMGKIGPEGEEFVRFLDEVGGKLSVLFSDARGGMFPGLEDGISSLLERLPEVRRVVQETSTSLGEIAAGTGRGLAGPEFDEFFSFLETDAQPILKDMAATAGNLADGFAAMLVAFAPLSSEFSSGFRGMTADFADWAHELDDTETFRDFLDYIDETTPKVLDLLGSLIGALVQIVEAAAPVGDVMLPIFTKLFDVIAAIADTPLGPTFIAAGAAIGLYGRGAALADITTGGLVAKLLNTEGGLLKSSKAARTGAPSFRQWADAVLYSAHSTEVLNKATNSTSKIGAAGARRALESRDAVLRFAKSAVPATIAMGALGAEVTGTSDKFGLANTTALTLAGTFLGPLGTGIGFAAGALLDMKGAAEQTGDALSRAQAAVRGTDIDQQTKAIADLQREADRLGNSNTLGANFSRILNFGTFDRDVNDVLSRYQTNLRLAGRSTGDLGTLLTNGLGPAVGQAATALSLAAQDGEAFARSLQNINGNLAETDAFLAYKQAILGVKDAFKQNGQTVDTNTKAGLANFQALQTLAHNIVSVLNTLPEGERRTRFANQAANQIKALANQLDPTGKTAKQLLDDLDLLDKRPPAKPKIDADKKSFNDKMTAANKALDLLGNRTARVKVDPSQIQAAKDAILDLLSLFPGGPGPKHRTVSGGHQPEKGRDYADGGYVSGPGTSTSDSIRARLSDGEYVMRAAAVQKYGVAMFDQMNTMGFASGGYVSSSQSVDYDRLAAAMLNARPLYGDVHVNGDPTEYKRQLQQDRARAALSGGRPR